MLLLSLWTATSLAPPSVARGIWPWESYSFLWALIFPFGHSQAHPYLVESIEQLYRTLVLVLEPMLTTICSIITFVGSLTSLNLLRLWLLLPSIYFHWSLQGPEVRLLIWLFLVTINSFNKVMPNIKLGWKTLSEKRPDSDVLGFECHGASVFNHITQLCL